MLSYWEKNSFLKYDYLIVGAGITGLSAAISLKEIDRKADILILERGILPSGASTKNAGFACFGSASEILDDYRNIGKEQAISLIEDRMKGLEMLKKRLGENNIDLKYDGGYELIFDHDEETLSKLDDLNHDLKGLFPANPFREAPEKIKSFEFESVKNLIFTPYEGQLDTGKMMRALTQKAQSMGISLFTGVNVESYEDHGNKVKVFTESIPFEGGKLILCTNGLSKDIIPEADIVPARGLVLVTHPLDDLPFQGSFHFDRGFYYFRNFENRVIFGGGRNLDVKSEETTTFGINEIILDDLKDKLSTVILPGKIWETDAVWSGIMGFGKGKLPQVKMHSTNVAYAAGLSGMGVALGSLIGQKVARLVTSS